MSKRETSTYTRMKITNVLQTEWHRSQTIPKGQAQRHSHRSAEVCFVAASMQRSLQRDDQQPIKEMLLPRTKSVLQAYIDGVLEGRPKDQFNQLQAINHTKG